MSDDLESEIKQNIRKRGICKSKMTSFTKFLNSVTENDQPIDDIKGIELETRLSKLSDVFLEFDTYQNFIELNCEDLDEQILERETFENTYYNLLATAKNILNRHFECGNRVSDRGSGSEGTSNESEHLSQRSQHNRLQSRPQLPSIPLPKFDGNFEKWLEFRDTFKSLVHNNENISSIEKFHFLRGSLENKAKNILHNLEISEVNYPVAWDLLCERYDNKTILINNHLKLLFELPSMTKESAFDIRRLLDGITKGMRSLETLEIPVNTWDIIIIFLMSNKLDTITAREWQEQKSKQNLPTLNEFKIFLKSKAELLETIESNSKESKIISKSKHCKNFLVSNQTCFLCNSSNHNIANCNNFLKLSVYDRYEKAKHLRLCLNCLKSNHISKNCKSSTCKKCSAYHHTLLHYDKKVTTKNVSNKNSSSSHVSNGEQTFNHEEDAQNSSVNMSSSNLYQNGTLLSTALVQIFDAKGMQHTCRVLLDSGSQSNFVTEELCKTLDLIKQNINISIVGINQVTSSIKFKCNVTIESLHNAFRKTISCLVVPKISDCIPNQKLNLSYLNIPKHLKLADPNFGIPGSIDLLLGVDTFYQLLCIGQFSLGKSQPIMQKTRLGWIISGSYNYSNAYGILSRCNFGVQNALHDQLERFWAIEEPLGSLKPILSSDDKECESIFINTVKRDKFGRFIVQIPFKQSPSVLGDSSLVAKKQFFSVERKLQKNPKMRELYVGFMFEYESMGHMSLDNGQANEMSYFLPHHGVMNDHSSTTRLRVVFNGSSPTDNGVSLNDIQFTGPNIQDDILSILLRFRIHNVVVCADVAKMYRMIMIQEDQRNFQKIYWRNNPSENLKVYKLNTVTYGTASGSFLAIRCLKQLGLEYEDKYPEAANIILHNFYVDDMLFGTETVESAVTLSRQVAGILETGCFTLRKWISNSPEVIHQLLVDDSIQFEREVLFGNKTENKTLGLYWLFRDDALRYHISDSSNEKYTKRSVLSSIAKIYDPLGLLSPCIIFAKIIMQKLWSAKIGWDESLPSDIHSLWHKFKQSWSHLNSLSIPRQMITSNVKHLEIHGFCDSSIAAYGGCLYLKSICTNGEIKISLVFAKAKVAPLKVITLPRLELCGALVLAQLLQVFKQSISLNVSATYLWTDSSVVLGWISQVPSNLNIFVGNRVSQIQSLTEISNWHHVKSGDNPADILSRGLYPEKLVNCNFWWSGPEWLKREPSEWPKSSFEMPILPEMKKQVKTSQLVLECFPIHRFSNLIRLKRSFAYLLRFYHNCKLSNNDNRQSGPLSVEELNEAMQKLVLISQRESFPDEYTLLLTNKRCSKGPLSALNPFIDPHGILRVGGRLQLSDLDYSKKHPAVLSSKHMFTKLLFVSEHRVLLHAGPQHLLASIREHYWPIGGRNLAKKVVHQCVTCFKVKPKPSEQIMGNLPKERVISAPPFHTTGIDYAGPFSIKSKNGRGAKITKCYVCLFICLTTRAVHLELVSELTSAAFIATFRRFVSRRGKPACIWSDNGSNFVGARSYFKELTLFLHKQGSNLSETISNEGVNWKFIPPKSPNFGGIWEAGIKACKFHMKRVMGNASLTFENFCTLLCQIEATLNSRPLVPLSSDPSDYDVLTPAHFLIGRRLTSLPDADVKNVPENRLSCFQRIQNLHQHFWNRWSKEYLVLLQQRFKWKHPQKNLALDELVIIKEDHLPPLSWKLGRITALHPGEDGHHRVASVRTSGGILKRPVTKLCPLPGADS